MSAYALTVWLAVSPIAAPSAAPANLPAKAAAAPTKSAALKAAAQPSTPAPAQAAPPAPAQALDTVVEQTPLPAAAPVVQAAVTVKPDADWLAQRDAQSSAPEPLQRWPLVVALLLLLAAGGAFLLLRVRQGQVAWPGGVSGHAIDILAIKALGQKHRLVLVEAAGERLLLSATEHEVRLLSHISSQEGLNIDAHSDAAQVDALTGSMGHGRAPAPARRTPAPLMHEPAAQSPAPGPLASDASASAYATYMSSEPAAPMVAPAGPASHESLSAEALYEGAARSMDLDEQDDELDDAQAAPSQDSPDAIGSDVAGLARWRQAAAQGADTWGNKQV